MRMEEKLYKLRYWSEPTDYPNIFRYVREELKEKMMERGNYLIGSIASDGRISFADYPKYHRKQDEAKIEAERLAKANPGKTFIVVMVAGTVVSTGVQWN